MWQSVPAYRNVVQKEAEKKLKYEGLCIDIKRTWNLKCMIVPVIIGATGILTKDLRENLEAVPGKHSAELLQKTAVPGVSHIIREMLQCETGSLSCSLEWRSAREKRLVSRDRTLLLLLLLLLLHLPVLPFSSVSIIIVPDSHSPIHDRQYTV
jgi:hypothetical protein